MSFFGVSVHKQVLTHMFLSHLAVVELLVDYNLACRFALLGEYPQNVGSAGAIQSIKVRFLT